MTTKTASQLTRGDIIQSEQGPSRVLNTTPDGHQVNVDLTTINGGTAWGDSYPSGHTFTLA